MKKNKLRVLATVIPGIMLAFGLTSCSKDPVEPINQVEEKLHEDPAKMVIELVECHMHGDWNSIQNNGGGLHQNAESPAKRMKRVQQVTYEMVKGKGWQIAPGSQSKFYVIRNGEYQTGKKFTPAPVYLLFIKYYNSKGEFINGEFATEGQEKIHQHFFTTENARPARSGVAEADDNITRNLIDYVYADTTPWDKTNHEENADITGDDNPIGFKGVIRFLRAHKQFDLRIKLYHGYKSKLNPATGKPCPFDNPAATLIQNGAWDINVTIPVVVFMDRDADLIEELDENANLSAIPEDGLSAKSNNIIRNIMDAYGLSWKEALEEFVDYTWRTGSHDSAKIWL